MQIVTTMSYERLREIGAGEGRNSKVYLARDEQFAGEVAVKEVDKAAFPSTARYFNEAQAVHASRCTHVVPVHWASQTGDLVCLAMPYYRRGSLAKRIASGPLLVREIIRIAQDVCAGAAHVHRAGFVHLDEKPSNILFDDQDRALLADFGQAVDVGSLGVATGSFRVYQEYAPPELFASGAVSFASDVYQIGLTLYRAVNGEPFFRVQRSTAHAVGLRAAILSGDFPSRTYLPHVPHALRRAISKALSVDPAQRQQSATEFADELGAVRVNVDWHVDLSQPNCVVWAGKPTGRAMLEVRRVERGGRFDVELWSQGSQRRRARLELWSAGLTARQAEQALTRCFRAVP